MPIRTGDAGGQSALNIDGGCSARPRRREKERKENGKEKEGKEKGIGLGVGEAQLVVSEAGKVADGSRGLEAKSQTYSNRNYYLNPNIKSQTYGNYRTIITQNVST